MPRCFDPEHDRIDSRLISTIFRVEMTQRNKKYILEHSSMEKTSFRTSWSFLEVVPQKSLNQLLKAISHDFNKSLIMKHMQSSSWSYFIFRVFQYFPTWKIFVLE